MTDKSYSSVCCIIIIKGTNLWKVYLVFILPTQLAFLLCNLRLQFIWQTWKLSEDCVHMQWIRAEIHFALIYSQSEVNAFFLLTSCRCSRWNWSPISWSFWPMQASTLWATGCCRGSRSIPFRSPSVSRCLASWSPASSNSAGKCNRKPALPVGCQRLVLSIWQHHKYSDWKMWVK